ncbi:hypothetical protein CARUB_v10019486mg [Capsella rubella]|uniref:Fe2OG dioxygenase domain-containing protein n=1 Tax=Capsella rubella TaxID=81985 RepID=R0H9M7_9BRAS|nr:hypothetical protein CARUB_v10019486mg [Capsella rubella]
MENKTNQEEVSIINVSSLTCIDLANSNLHQSAASLKQACMSRLWIFLCHKSWYNKKFFALPLEEKMKALRNEKHQGYSSVLSHISDNQIHGDYKESYFIGIEGSIDDVLPGWRETMEKYHQEALRVCKAIARVLALALNVDEDYFDKPEMLGNPLVFMRLIHYEGISDPSKGIYGCGPHSDFGMMTLLATDNVMDLQICKDKDMEPRKWEYVPSIKDAYIVNIGDLLERWSNGIFKSTLHRVLGNGQDRYSIPFFVEPSHDCLVECLPTCQSENIPPK